MSTLVFDVETVPVEFLYARLLEMPDDTSLPDVEAAWAAAEKPFKPGLQRIVSLAVAWIGDSGALQKVATLGPDEPTALHQFFETLHSHHPVLTGWNTSGFDLPVILTRALVHRIDVGDFYKYGLPYNGYLKRYADRDHRDLMDLQSFYRAVKPLSLNEMALLLGVPGKLDTAGNQVSTLYAEGEMQRIHDYCQHDVLTTAWVYRFIAEHRGWWTSEQAAKFEESSAAFLAEHRGTHWDEWATTAAAVAGETVRRIADASEGA